jgi:hypothetical protein
MNTKTAITQQLMRTARTLEVEWKKVLLGSISTGAKEDEPILGAEFHHVTTRSRLPVVLKLIHGEQRITETADAESVHTGARLYIHILTHALSCVAYYCTIFS